MIEWACSCPAFQYENSTERSLAYAEKVRYQYTGEVRGRHHFLAWSEKERGGEEVYNVMMGNGLGRGWCKHIAACSKHFVGDWLDDVFFLQAETVRQRDALEKMVKRLTKEIEKQSKKEKELGEKA